MARRFFGKSKMSRMKALWSIISEIGMAKVDDIMIEIMMEKSMSA